MFYSPRKAFIEDVIEVPATATTSSTVILSEDIKPFEESSFGAAYVFVKLDTSKTSVSDPKLGTWVSYDEGETIVQTGETTLNQGFTVIPVANLAPRVKFSLDLNGSTLAEGHGIQVDVLLMETNDNFTRTLFGDITDVPEEGVSADETIAGDPIALPHNTRALNAVIVSDNEQLTGVTAVIQSSWDGVNWWNIGTTPASVDSDFVEVYEESNLFGNYARVNLVVADGGSDGIDEYHEIVVNAWALAR
jgi:predicted component of type VI protein secretion system